MAAGVVSAPLIIASSHTHTSRRDIDTETRVFIQSDTPGVLIFYTLDGSRPEAEPSSSSSRSRRYIQPIHLPAGRVAVRAIAVASDGRRSSTVTKMFVVQSGGSNLEKVLEVGRQPPPQEPWSSAGSPGDSGLDQVFLCPAEVWTGGDGSAVQKGPQLQDPGALKRVRSTQTSRLVQDPQVQDPQVLWDKQVPADADLSCPHCLRARPPDPFCRFCPSCGAKVSDRRLPPTGVEQEHRVCGCCGSGNPVNMSTCLTCESYLQPVCVRTSLAGASAGRTLSCCCRWNQPESRCCSSKPVQTCVVCWCCGASGHPSSWFCSACSASLRTLTPPTAPPNPPVDHLLNPTVIRGQATPSPDCGWKLAPPTAEKSTQTVGLYYPSSTMLQKERERERERERALQLSRDRERQPPLTPVSPGKGYWRKQLDHVCAHLRSYTQNNAPFRTLLADPCMGQLLSAAVQDDQQQLTLTISFALVGQGDTAGGGVDTSEPPTGGSSLTGSPSSRRVTEALMEELAPGRGQLSVVQQLLDQGADPACCRSNGRHALAVAVLNGHHQLLPVLVQRGADVDQLSGPTKNSALHEAAALGSEGLEAAGVLIRCGASVSRKNARGLTPFQLASDAACSPMVTLLAAQTGLALLGKLVQRK